MVVKFTEYLRWIDSNDNPFIGLENVKEATYSFGHRNPQGMFLYPKTGKIWTHEHDHEGGDEINS